MKVRNDGYAQPYYVNYRFDKPSTLESGLLPITIVGLEKNTRHIMMRDSLEMCDGADCVNILKDMIRRAEHE